MFAPKTDQLEFPKRVAYKKELKQDCVIFERDRAGLKCVFDPAGTTLRVIEETPSGDMEINLFWKNFDGRWEEMKEEENS